MLSALVKIKVIHHWEHSSMHLATNSVEQMEKIPIEIF